MSIRFIETATVALSLLSLAAVSLADDVTAGHWDGKTLSAALSGPYEDKTQAEIPFGRRSFYMAPWRAYMDTWTPERLLESIGINFNVEPIEAEATAQALATAGIRSARVEIGWGNLQFTDPTQLDEAAGKRLTTILSALKKHAIRPLILLNANSGGPCPLLTKRYNLARAAAKGETSIRLSMTSGLLPFYSGLRGQSYQIAYPLITSVDTSSGKCTLSAPLTKPIPAGDIEVVTLKYQPFSGRTFQDGAFNPASDETISGWKSYVAAVCQFAKSILFDPTAGDAGFDIEVWNEYTFGSEFLDAGNYYSPHLKYREDTSYSQNGRTTKGVEAILPITIDYIRDSNNELPGISIISGFSNQRPWDNGAEMWSGQSGFSRHYYTDITLKPLSKATDPMPGNAPLSALGQPDGKPDNRDWNTAVPDSYFVPTVNISMPEMWHYGFKTEFVTRDLQPFPGLMKNHFRFAASDVAGPAQVWLSEYNTWRRPWLESVMKETGVSETDPRLIALSQATGARALLRSLVFQSHKGIRTIDYFAAKDDDLSFAVLPRYFFETVKADGGVLTPKASQRSGAQMAVLSRLVKTLTTHPSDERRVTITRPIGVSELIEHKPRLVFKGDGTLAHPDRFNRDDFAILPFQMTEERWAVGYYVVTHNMVQSWDSTKKLLDPSRYTMPDQEFTVTLTNLCGTGAQVSAYDPLTDRTTAAVIERATLKSITVRVTATDTPRFLVIREAHPGVLIAAPRFQRLPRNMVALQFATNVPASASVSWGHIPERNSAKTVSVSSRENYRVIIPLTAEKQGVHVSITYKGLTAVWPRWDYDFAGRLPSAAGR